MHQRWLSLKTPGIEYMEHFLVPGPYLTFEVLTTGQYTGMKIVTIVN